MTGAALKIDTPWAFPWERRTHVRSAVDLKARLHGPRGEVPVQAVDVSRGGVLVCVRAGELCSVPPLSDRSVLHVLARSVFGAHLEICFLEKGVTVGARLARMVSPPDDPGMMLLGLRFVDLLTPMQLRRLGVSMPGVLEQESPQTTAAVADPRTSLWVATTLRGSPEAGALCSGPLLGIADHAVAFRDREGNAGETVARLAGRPLKVTVREGNETLWTADANLITVRVLESLAGAVEATLLTSTEPGAVLGPRLHRNDLTPA